MKYESLRGEGMNRKQLKRDEWLRVAYCYLLSCFRKKQMPTQKCSSEWLLLRILSGGEEHLYCSFYLWE